MLSRALVILCCTSSLARASLVELDPVPAATLLVPYFEVDLVDPMGPSTTIGLAAADADPVLTRMVLWTDRGVPVLGVDLALPGNGSMTIDLGKLLRDGTLPVTDVSAFASCSATSTLTPIERERVRAALRGLPDPTSYICSGHAFGDDHARGYVTIDVMSDCTPLYPGEAGYFDAGVASTDNRIYGDYTYLEPGLGGAAAESALPIEADPDDPLTNTAGAYTFYGSLVGFDASDHREPLPSNWIVPITDRGAESIVIWRAPGAPMTAAACTTPEPAPPALGILEIEHDSGAHDVGYYAHIRRVSQAVIVDGPELPIYARAGWLAFVFDSNTSGPIQLGQGVVVRRGQGDNCGDLPVLAGMSEGMAVDSTRYDWSYGVQSLGVIGVGGPP